jgi:CBS domain-containing protein
MTTTTKPKLPRRPVLGADTAEELMTPNPVSIRDTATVREALALLVDKGFSAAPVIDAAGRPVGVLSRTDLLVHERETAPHLKPAPTYYEAADLLLGTGERLREGFEVECVDPTEVRDIMTPMVFAVSPETPALKAVEDMVAHKVHRLFVVDHAGILVGVISALDVLRYLIP